jgi:hypothetical protein
MADLEGACADGLNQLAAGFDDELRSLFANLACRLSGLIYFISDYFRLTQDIFADAEALGTPISPARAAVASDCSPRGIADVCCHHSIRPENCIRRAERS